jgi:dethiobiotin synthetase
MAAVAMGLKAKVILVVGMRLGCLNHAILTYQAIQNSACEIVGWIANSLAEDMPYLVENIASLQERLTAPLLGYIPYQANVAEQVNVASLCFERGVAGRASVQCVANLQHQVT